MQSTNKQSEIFQEYYAEDANVYLVYVHEKKPVYKRLKERDRRTYNTVDKTIIKNYFPNNSIDRPYTFIKAVEESEVQVTLLEQYQTINFFIECFSIAI